MSQMQVVATADPWCAPVVVTRYEDGSSRIARTLDDEPATKLVRARTVFPHARVYVDGMLSPFDGG